MPIFMEFLLLPWIFGAQAPCKWALGLLPPPRDLLLLFRRLYQFDLPLGDVGVLTIQHKFCLPGLPPALRGPPSFHLTGPEWIRPGPRSVSRTLVRRTPGASEQNFTSSFSSPLPIRSSAWRCWCFDDTAQILSPRTASGTPGAPSFHLTGPE